MDYQSISHQKPLNGQYYHDHHDHDDVHSNFAQNDRRDDGKSSRVYAGRVNARTLNYDDYMDMNSAYDRRGDSARNPSGNSDPQRNGYYADRGAVRDAEPIYENQGVYNRGEAERVRSPGDSEQRPPVPAEFRTRFIEQLADTQTPTTRTSYLMSAYNEEKKKSYPTFFQFPESPPSQEQRSVPKLTAAPPSNRSQQPKQEEWQIHRGHRIRVLVQRSPKVPADQRRDIPLSSAPPSSTANPPQRNHDLIPAINTIKEDPEMPDADILETRLRSLRKNYSLRNGQRVRLSIQMADLEGKSHEELVLLLIQLRREQSTLERQRDHLRTVLDGQRDSEKQYKSSIDENQDPSGSLVNQHESYMITKAQINDLDNQIEVQKPLVNLLDNLVKMGSLYNGQTDMLLSQYKTHMLSPDQIKPEKEMLTFTRQLQEDKLVKGQQDDIDQLRQEDADLEEKLRKLHLLDRELQELSVAVTSLREDKLMMEGAISDTKREQHQRKDDPRDMELLDKQLQMQENQLSKIMFELAEKSKQLEEVRAENDKVEMDVTLLRSKVYDLSKSNSLPSMTSESYRAKMKLKDELSQVQGIMDGLKSDAQQLSAAMNTLRKSNPDLTAVDSVPKKMKSKTYLETDMDTMRTVDIGVKTQDSGLRRANSAREVGEIDDSFVSSDMSPMDISQADDNTKRYFGLIPPKESKKNTVRDVKRESGRRVRGSPVRPVDQYQSGNLTRSQSLPRSFEVSPQFPRQDEPSPTDDDQVDSLIAGQQPWRKEAPNQNSPHAIAPSPTNSASSWHGNDPMRNYTDLSQLPPSAWNSGSLPRHKPASQSENSRKSPSTYINLPESRVKSPYSDIRDESRLSGQTNSPNTSFTQRVPFDPLQTRFKSPIGEPEMSPIRVNTPIRAQIVPEMQQTPGRVQSPIRGQIVAEMQQTPGSVQSPIRAQTEAEMQQMPGRVQSPIRAQTEAEMQTPVHRSPNTDSEVRTQFWQPPHLQRNNESSSPQRWKPSYSDSMQSPVNTRKDYLDSAQKEPIYVNTRSYSSLTPENRPIPTSPSASRKPYESPERRSTAPMRDSPTRRTVDSSQQPRSVSPAFRGRDLDFTSQGNLPQASHVFVNDSLDNSSEFMSPRTTSAPSIYDTQRITGQYLPPRYDDHNSADDSSQFVSPKSTPNQRFSPMPGSPWIDDRNLDVDSEVTSSKPMSPIYDRDQRRPISPVTQQRGQISNLTRAASSPASSQPRNHSGSTSHYAKPNKPRYNNNNGKNFARTPPSNDEPAQLQVHTDTVSTLKRSRSETDRDIDEMDRLFGVQKQVNPSWGMRANYEYDDDSDIIDREILRSPELIEIPERYIPEVENLTEFEYEKRQEKAEKLRRLLSAQSMQEFTHAEIDNNGSREMDVHDKVNQEKLQRQAVLEMRQSIAKQVIQRSKEVAEAAKQRNDERRRTLSGGAVELKT
ncbi:uncharacterized protein LOC141913271 isoform X2 [Tubulanus polymorphus]|uniref:uncharacterized protein LOC141913271 isoform X2 n=1 Tax=Tubulanus polymorphus TaxID=672921 RepID=UPI003DA69502